MEAAVLDHQVMREARALSRLSRPLLLLGERGTGKTTLASSVHRWSGRRGEFVLVNCAALTESLFEAELFGYEKGAFTGAVNAKDGRFALADRGTIFLDEIGELPQALQAKLLAVAEGGEIWPVGATRPKSVDVRVVAATNRPVDDLRPDLLDRFVCRLTLPALRERGDAVECALAMVPEVSRELGEHVALDEQACAWVASAPWDGNLRQLYHALLAAAALGGGSVGVAELERATGVARRPSLHAAAIELSAKHEWWTTTDLVQACGCSESTARRWLRANAVSTGGTKSRRWAVRDVAGP